MVKTVSVSEIRQQLSSFLNWVKTNQRDVVIQNRGRAEAVIIPIADYELLQEARQRRIRQQAVDELRQIAQAVGAANEGLSADEAQEIAAEVVSEAVGALRQQNKVVFQE